MKKDVKELWLAALRSGKYTQTRGRLERTEGSVGFGPYVNDPVGFCCLGVLCEVAKEAGVITDYSADAAMVPGTVQRWAGLSGSGQNTLIQKNDSARLTFEQIADYIEAKFPGKEA